MSAEKVGVVEKIEAFVEVAVVGRHVHNGLAPTDCVALTDNLHVFID